LNAAYTMNFPSGDQDWATGLMPSDASSRHSRLVPVASISYSSRTLLRFDEKTIVRPSGDQTAPQSAAGSDVNGVAFPAARSNTQMSERIASAPNPKRFDGRGSNTLTATRLPSGDNAGSL
jgi:hypothetical protein